jgi:GNAT superfamily N-acetyltransferase
MDQIALSPDLSRLGAAWLLIRRLGPADRAALADHLLALPPADRQARFDATLADAAIHAQCAALDLAAGGDAIGCGAFAGDRLVGAALALRGAGFAEIAVTVAPDWRRRRVAAMLVCEVCARAAREFGAGRALFQFSPSNAPIQGLVRHLGGMPRRLEGLAEIPLAAG